MQKTIKLPQGTQNDMLQYLNKMPVIAQMKKTIIENNPELAEHLANVEVQALVVGSLEMVIATPDAPAEEVKKDAVDKLLKAGVPNKDFTKVEAEA